MASSYELEAELKKKYGSGSASTSNKESGSGSTKEQSTTDSFEIERKLLDKYSPEKKEEREKAVSTWFEKYNSTLKGVSDYNKKLGDRYTSDISGGFSDQIVELISEFDNIKDYADRSGLPNAQRYLRDLKELSDSISKGNDFMSQFAGEDEYNSYVARQKDYEEKRNLDTDAYDRATRILEQTLKEYDSLSRWEQDAKGRERLEKIRQQYGSMEDLGHMIDDRNVYLQEAKLIQEKEAGRERFDAVRENADFDAFKGFDSGNTEIGYRYINADENGRADLEQKYGQYAEEFGYHAYDSLNDQEKEVYNYLMNTGNRQGAADYLKYLREDLSYRKGAETDAYLDKLISENPDAKALRYVFMANAGYEQHLTDMRGMGNLIAGNEEYVPATATQVASSLIRENLAQDGKQLPQWLGGGSTGQVLGDIISTSANMAPSILTSIGLNIVAPGAGTVAGSAMMGMSAAGGAYQEAINAGYDKDQARGYGLLVGTSELVMEKVLGGISALGGNILGKTLTSGLDAADTAFKMVAKRIGGGMLSEFGEEYLQEVLTPWFKNLTLGTHEEVNPISADALYAGILGALTAFPMEAPGTIGEAAGTSSTGRQLQEGGISAERLAQLGKTFSADTVAYQLAGKVNENTDAFTMGRLFNEIGASLSEQNKTDITNALVAKGMDPNIAQKNAEVMAYVMEGGKLSDILTKMIQKNDVLAKVMQEVLIDENSTVNQRMKGYTEAAEALNGNQRGNVIPKAQEADSIQKVEEKPSDMGNNKPTTEDEQETDTEGKTIQISTGKPVQIQEVASIKDGKMMLKLTDGRTVNADDVNYGTESEALVYEAVKEMGATAQAANVFVKGFKAVQEDGVTASAYAHGLSDAYRYGKLGVPLNTVKDNPFLKTLNPGQQDYAWRQGRRAAGKQAALNEAKVRRPKGATASGKGGVYFTGRDGRVADWDSRMKNVVLKDTQESAMQTMKVLSNALGLKFYVHESYRDKNGKLVIRDSNGKERSANGFYDPSDGSIHIDLNAGADGQGTMLFTMSHEMTHFVRQWSPSKYQKLANFLVAEFSEKYGGETVDQLVHGKMKDTGLEYDDAFEEVVADAMETMLTDGNLVEKLAKLKKQDKSIWQKIKDFIDNWAAKIRQAYEGLSPDSTEGRMVAEMVDSIDQLQQLFAEGLVEASENYKAGQDKASKEAYPAAMAASARTEAKDTGKHADRDLKADDKLSSRDYTYDSLVNKPDMVVTAVDDAIPSNRADVVALAKKNAAKVGKVDPKTGSISVHVDDINAAVILGTDGLKHGLRRTKNPRNDANYIVTVRAGEIIKNSIKINEANPKKDSATGSYVLIGVASNTSGDKYIVRSIVNQFKNELASMDVLYAINAKKELAALSAPRSAAKPLSVTSSTISIAELLDYVNQYFPDILPEDVLKHYGYDSRPVGDFGENVLYSARDTESVSNRSLLANALESAAVNDIERKRLQEYKAKIEEAQAAEEKLRELNLLLNAEQDQKRLKEIRLEAQQTANRITIFDKQLLRLEATKPLQDVLKREQKAAYDRGVEKGKQAKEAEIDRIDVKRQEVLRNYRATREELRGVKDDTRIIEREFIRLAREYEKLNEKNNQTISDLRKRLGEESKKHTKDINLWAKEFTRLMKEYEAAGKDISNLEAKIEHQRNAAKRNVDGRKRTILRNKIRKDIRELDKILNHGSKKRNVKQGMQDIVSKAIRSGEVLFADLDSDIDMVMAGMLTDMSAEEQRLYEDAKRRIRLLNPNGDKTAEEIQAFLKRNPKNELQKVLDKLHHAFERERIRINNTQASEAFQSLADAYESLKDSNDQYIAMAFNENVLDHLKMLKRKTEGTIVRDMDQKQLQTLHDGYKMIMKTIRDANNAFVDGRSIQADAEQLVAELEQVKKPDGKVAVALQNVFNSVGWDYEKFYYALERINSPTLKRLFRNLAESENITMRDVQEAKEFQSNTVAKYHYNDWDIDKKIDHTFVDNNGKKFQLTLGEMMSLYAYSRREGADKHIEVGGFTFGKKALTDPKPADTYKLTAGQVEKITSMLTPEQKAFSEELQKFLTDVMGEKGNEVTMKLYGIKLYTEANYWPLHIAGEYKVKAHESQAQAAEGFKTMANAGFTHARNMNSTTPIVLEGFMEVWADHVNEMARYHGAVPALEDIRRVMNYSVYSEASRESVSVTAALTNAYGENAVEYFDGLYREANSGAVREKMVTAPAKALRLFRKGSVAYSLSVVIQQPASIHRAKAIVDRKYFGKHGIFTLANGTLRIFNRNKWNASYAEMMKYAPGVTMAKEIGGFDTSAGSSIRSYLMDTEKTFKQEWQHGTAKQKAEAVMGMVDDNPIANLPNVADKIAWIEMWEACKREVHAKNHNLSPVTEEFMQKVGQRFTEVVRATQVYDSMFSKSPMLNSKNTAVQSLVSFMNEPNTVANMAEDAVRKFARGDKRQAVKTVVALVTSIVSTNVLKSIIYAMRDDDEDETSWEKYVSAFAGNLINDINPFNYIPVARDIVSVKQGYAVERTDMAIIADVIKAAQALKDLANKNTSNMTEKELEKHDKKLTDAQWRMAETLAVFAGIPLKNIRRDVLAVANTVKTIKLDFERDTTKLSFRLAVEEGLLGSEFSANKLYEAIVSGDKELERRIRSEYDKDNEYRSAVRKALRENDQRITDAAIAWNNDDLETYQRIADEIIAEGKFSKTDVREAINAKANSLDKTEKEQTPEKKKGLFNADKFAVAISQENADMASAIREDIIETAKINGSDDEDAENSFNSSAKSALKKLYLEQGVTAEQVEKALRDYCDVGISEAEQLIREWNFEDKHEQSFSDMFNEYEKGNVTERDIWAAMKEIGMKEYEIAEKLRSTQENKAFQNKFQMTFSEARDLYMDDQLNRSKMREMLIYDGKTQMQADDTLREWDVAKQFDIPYDKLDDAYKYGDISRDQLYSAMIAVGETPKKAEEALACYDWLKARVKEHPDLQINDARKFVTSISDTCDEAEDYTLADYGISVNVYKQYKTIIADAHGVDEDGDGKTDSGTLRESKFNIINSMSLSKSQKDALAMISYNMKSIRRYAPWH